MCLCENHCLLTTQCFKIFVGIISAIPSQSFTRPLGSPRGLKGLLHMLNAIVSPTIVDYVSCFDFVFILFF